MNNSIRTMRDVLNLMGRQRGYTTCILETAQDGRACVVASSVSHQRALTELARARGFKDVQIESVHNAERRLRGNAPKPVLLDNGLIENIFNAAIQAMERAQQELDKQQGVQHEILIREVEKLRAENDGLRSLILEHLAPDQQDSTSLENFTSRLVQNVDKLIAIVWQPTEKPKKMDFIRGVKRTCTQIYKKLQVRN